MSDMFVNSNEKHNNSNPFELALPYAPEDMILSCRYIEKGLVFLSDGLHSCCLGTVASPVLVDAEEINSGKVNHKTIVEKRALLLSKLNAGDTSISCHGCGEVNEKVYKDVCLDYLGECMIIIQHYTVCNMQCSYCTTWKNGLSSSYSEQSIIDILKCFSEKGKLLGGSWIPVSGGEPTLLKNLDTLIEGLAELKIGDICIFTNCVKHSETIEMHLRNDSVFITTSIDAGIPSTFKKIHGTEMQSVLDTLVKYRKTGTTQLRLKYIITEENRNDDDLYAFVFMMLALKPDLVTIAPEYPRNDAQIPHESAIYGAKLWYMLKKYGGDGIVIDTFLDVQRVDQRLTKFSSDIYNEFNRLCAEAPLTDEYNLLEEIGDTQRVVVTESYARKLKSVFNEYVRNDKKDNETIALWGYGFYAKSLCSDKSVRDNITVIVDSDKTKQGLKPFINSDIIIHDPGYLIENHVDAILIASGALHKSEIEDYIKRNVKYDVRVLG